MTSALVRDPLADHLLTPDNATFPLVHSTVNVRGLRGGSDARSHGSSR